MRRSHCLSRHWILFSLVYHVWRWAFHRLLPSSYSYHFRLLLGRWFFNCFFNWRVCWNRLFTAGVLWLLDWLFAWVLRLEWLWLWGRFRLRLRLLFGFNLGSLWGLWGLRFRLRFRLSFHLWLHLGLRLNLGLRLRFDLGRRLGFW